MSIPILLTADLVADHAPKGWLSPELYLRRPPAKNEQYRLDRMLHAAAQRGVKVNIIVYKEVTQALTCKFVAPAIQGCCKNGTFADTGQCRRRIPNIT